MSFDYALEQLSLLPKRELVGLLQLMITLVSGPTVHGVGMIKQLTLAFSSMMNSG